MNMSGAALSVASEVYLQTGFTRFDLHANTSVAHGDDALVGLNDKHRWKLAL